MKPKPKCSICGGTFIPGTVLQQQDGKPDKLVKVNKCNQCGDSEFSPEQYTALKAKT